MGSGNEEGCVDSVVLREAVGGGSSLRDRGRLEGWGHFFQMACRKGGWGGVVLKVPAFLKQF